MEDLLRLLARDPMTVAPADLAAGVRAITAVTEHRQDWSGRLIAAMRRHGMTWDEIEETTGIPVGTAHRWAAPHH